MSRIITIDLDDLTEPVRGGDKNYGAAQLARTLRLLVGADHGGSQTYRARIVSELADLIDPPKPDEPLGLGAVVEDADGKRWLRWWADGADHPSKERPWQCANGGASDRRWSDVAAVRVLSEGVQP